MPSHEAEQPTHYPATKHMDVSKATACVMIQISPSVYNKLTLQHDKVPCVQKLAPGLCICCDMVSLRGISVVHSTNLALRKIKDILESEGWEYPEYDEKTYGRGPFFPTKMYVDKRTKRDRNPIQWALSL